MTPTPSDRRRALAEMPSPKMQTSLAPEWYVKHYDTIKSSLKSDAAGEWLPLDQPIGDRRAHDGGPIDILLNANDRARIPDVYFCFYSKQYLTGGTDVPVILEGDPFNKITHWTLPPRLPPPPKKDAADE